MGWQEWVLLAEVVRSRGNRGELLLRLETDYPDQLEPGRKVILAPLKGSGRAPVEAKAEAEVETLWEHQGKWILKLKGIDSIDEAEALRGLGIAIPRAERRQPEPDEVFLVDLLGCTVRKQNTGETIGIVESWEETGGPVLLVIRTPDGEEALVPFTRAICPVVDLNRKEILADPPEGLMELNR